MGARGRKRDWLQVTQGDFQGDENVVIPIVVMVPWVYIVVKTHQIVHFNCTYLFT